MSLIAFVLMAVLSVASGSLTGSGFVFIAIAAIAVFVWSVSKYVFFQGAAADQWADE